MAAIQARVQSGSVSATAATPKTILQIVAPTNQRVKLSQFSVSLDGATSTAVPVAFRLLRQTTAGTFTNATNIPVLIEKELTETVQTNYQTVATAEPTAGDVLMSRLVPAYNGLYEWFAPFGQEIIIQGGGRLGFEINAPATVNVRIDAQIEE